MIDFDKIEDKVIQNKILITNKDISVEKKPIVFFLNNDEIVYIGKTEKKVIEYVLFRSEQINCTHYFSEFVNIDEIDNLIAELILTIKPIYHNKITKNTKYISNNKAKELYHIDKREFRKYWDESIGLKLGNSLFLEKKVFDDIFSISKPFTKNMPKIGTLINSIDDIKNTPIDWYGQNQDYSEEKSKDGKVTVTLVTTYDVPITKNYNNLQLRFKHSFEVISFLDSNRFEAYSQYKNITKIFDANEDTWQKIPSEYEQERVNESYLESLKS